METGTADNFQELISKGAVLVDFNADWCGPCKMMAPVVEEFSAKHPEVKVVSVNIDDEGELAEKFEVASIPCLVLFRDGEEVTRKVGVTPMKKLEKMLEK